MRYIQGHITKSWWCIAENHGYGFYGGNVLLFPVISYSGFGGYHQIGFGWFKFSASITFFKVRKYEEQG